MAANAWIVDKEGRLQAHAERKEQKRRDQKRQRELEEVEGRIAQIEDKLQQLEQGMADPELYQDQSRWRQVSGEHADLKEKLEAAYLQWEALQEPA